MGVLKTGLLSVTFRALPPEDIVRIAAEAGLDAIEWGGDIHVPHGDLEKAAEAARLTRAAGLSVRSYGSYYRLGVEGQPFTFEDVLATAVRLGAPAVRVWAGNRGSAETDESARARVTEDALRSAELARRVGVTVCLEYHSRTLTDTCDSAIRLLRDASHPHLRTLWQPPLALSPAERLADLERISPWLEYVHCFHWAGKERAERLPLSEGTDDWRAYLDVLRRLPGERHAMLEFVRNDDPAQAVADGKTLIEIVNELG